MTPSALRRTSAALVAAALVALASPALAVAPCSAGIGQHGLTFTGSSAKQNLVLDIDAAGVVVASLDCNLDGDFADTAGGDLNAVGFGNQDQIHVALKGNDTVTINQNGAWTGQQKDFQLFLGAGTNAVTYNSNGNAITANSRILFEVAGGSGSDSVNLNFAGNAVDQSSLLLRAEMGAGNDVVNLALPTTSPTGRLNADLSLGVGANAFTLTQGAFFTQGEVNVDIEGGPGIDTVTLNPTETLAGGRVRVNAALAGGNDKFVANLDLANFDVLFDAELYLSADGGAGNDIFTVTRNGTTPTGTAIAVAATFDVRLNGGLGNDLMTVDLGSGGIDQLTGGTIRLRADGGTGNDILNFALDSADATAPFGPGIYDVLVTGGAGIDTVNTTHNATGAVSYLQGDMILDAGAGTVDTCTTSGSSAASLHLLNCEL
jgi:hypothetical protein